MTFNNYTKFQLRFWHTHIKFPHYSNCISLNLVYAIIVSINVFWWKQSMNRAVYVFRNTYIPVLNLWIIFTIINFPAFLLWNLFCLFTAASTFYQIVLHQLLIYNAVDTIYLHLYYKYVIKIYWYYLTWNESF